MEAAVTMEPLEELVREQAALRRVATLVARAPSRSEVFAAVTGEVAVLLGASRSSLLRVRNPDLAGVVAAWSEGTAPPIPIGHRGAIDGRGILGQMLRTRRPVTIEDFSVVGGAVAALMRELGIHSGVGAPIILAGEVWGALNVTWPAGVPIPARAEQRVAAFTELVAYAIENAENRYELAASRARIVEAAEGHVPLPGMPSSPAAVAAHLGHEIVCSPEPAGGLEVQDAGPRQDRGGAGGVGTTTSSKSPARAGLFAFSSRT